VERDDRLPRGDRSDELYRLDPERVVPDGTRATCRFCGQEIIARYTIYGNVWVATKEDTSGRVETRAECPEHVRTLVRMYGEHQPVPGTEIPPPP